MAAFDWGPNCIHITSAAKTSSSKRDASRNGAQHFLRLSASPPHRRGKPRAYTANALCPRVGSGDDGLALRIECNSNSSPLRPIIAPSLSAAQHRRVGRTEPSISFFNSAFKSTLYISIVSQLGQSKPTTCCTCFPSFVSSVCAPTS